MSPKLLLVSFSANDFYPICSIQPWCLGKSLSYMHFLCVFEYTDGIEFFCSENSVLLTAGDAEGKLHPKYFKQALRLRPTSKEKTISWINIICVVFKAWTIYQHLLVHFCSVFQGASCLFNSRSRSWSVTGHRTAFYFQMTIKPAYVDCNVTFYL